MQSHTTHTSVSKTTIKKRARKRETRIGRLFQVDHEKRQVFNIAYLSVVLFYLTDSQRKARDGKQNCNYWNN